MARGIEVARRMFSFAMMITVCPWVVVNIIKAGKNAHFKIHLRRPKSLDSVSSFLIFGVILTPLSHDGPEFDAAFEFFSAVFCPSLITPNDSFN